MADRAPILQARLPVEPWLTERGQRLPGLAPVPLSDWLLWDGAFAAQMAYRDMLIAEKRDAVFQSLPSAEPAAEELLDLLLGELSVRSDYQVTSGRVIRPDGVEVDTGAEAPLITVGRLAQQDFALLLSDGSGHRLVAGLVCFPTSWCLEEKMGRSLAGLHQPVASYDPGMDHRVERIFSQLRAETPLMRANTLIYTDPDLHQPRREGDQRTLQPDASRYVRVERQVLRRLPVSGAIVFAIHTGVVSASSLSPDAFEALAHLRPELR